MNSSGKWTRDNIHFIVSFNPSPTEATDMKKAYRIAAVTFPRGFLAAYYIAKPRPEA
jgi:hypothetical protein